MVIDSLYTLGVFFFPSFSFFRSGCGPADGSHGLEAASVSYIFFGQSLPFLFFETWLLMVVVLLLLLLLLRQIYSNKSYASLTCKGWINSYTCSCGEDIPTEWRRRLGWWIMVLLLFCSCCCSSLEKKQENLHVLTCPWSRNGVRSSRFVSYLVLLM